jgi:hypothetical protein
MIHVPVKNKELLGILNEYPKLKDIEHFEEYVHLVSGRIHEPWMTDYYTGDEYLQNVLDQKQNHEGYPDYILAYNFKLSNIEHQIFQNNATAVWRNEFTKKLSGLNDEMMNFLATRNNALAVIYPPGGYISWHNNANAAAFNLIFSWSETGDGFFRYVDSNTKEIVTINDVPGWQCKAAYFGNYREPEKLFYHTAKTNCWRCTVSYTFDRSELSKEFREEIIEEISS